MNFRALLKTGLIASCTLFLPAIAFSAPVIKVDSINNDLGTIKDTGDELINFAFKVKNTGDAPLVLKEVRPGCGCTAVTYDTTIAAGKSGKIIGKLNLKNVQGPFRKSITVNSNSATDASLILSIAGTIEPILGFTPGSVTFLYNPSNKEVAADLTLTTKKADLKIPDIRFKIETSSSAIAWQSNLPIVVESTLSKPTIDKKSGTCSYTLHLSIPSASDLKGYGALTVKTNHPDRKELTINAVIQAH